MQELEKILRAHAARYPLMQPADAVKLIYQNEFGGGHLIRDEQACMRYLQQEYAGIIHDPCAALYEDIGNGIVRVHLAALPPEDVAALGQAFLRSAAEHTGSVEAFERKLLLLRQLTAQGCFRFSSDALEAYLDVYRRANYPPVSHSREYAAAYHPAYRIIRKP